jgi:hypothetical protein
LEHKVFLDWKDSLVVGSGALKWTKFSEFTLNYNPNSTRVSNFRLCYEVNPHNQWTGVTIRVNGTEVASKSWDLELNAVTGEVSLSPSPGKYIVEIEGWKKYWPYLFDAVFDFRIVVEADVEGPISVEKPATLQDIVRYMLYATFALIALYGASLVIMAVRRR